MQLLLTQIPKAKRHQRLECLFALFGSELVKAYRKQVGEIYPSLPLKRHVILFGRSVLLFSKHFSLVCMVFLVVFGYVLNGNLQNKGSQFHNLRFFRQKFVIPYQL